MKRTPLTAALQTVLVTILLVGLLLVIASFQSYESLASLLNQLATDGKFESFDLGLYQTLKLPFAGVGTVLIITSGLMLYRWEKTKIWTRSLTVNGLYFFSMLGKDSQSFIRDTKTGLVNQGWLANVAIVGTTLVAILIRLNNLNIPLGHDEAYMYNAFASRSFWHIVTNYHLPNNHVLLSLIIKIVIGLLGSHVWTLRLPTIVFGVCMVPAAYFFARRFYSQETAILSAILVAVFPILVQYSVLARGYVIIGLLTLVLFTLGDYVRTQINRLAWIMIAVLSALGFYTIPIMLFPYGALYLWLFVSWILDDTRSYTPKSKFLTYWVGSGVSAALLTLFLYTPIMVYSSDRFFGNGFIAPLEWDVFPITIWTRLRNTWTDWMMSIPIWIALLGVLGFMFALIFHIKISKQKVPPQLAFLIWIVTLLIARRPDMLPRFWLFLTAPLLVWSAAGVVEFLRMIPLKIRKVWNPAQITVAIIFVFVLVYNVLSIPSLPTRLRQKDALANAAVFLKNYVHQSDLVTASTARLPALRYYFNYYDLPAGTIRSSGKFHRAFVIVDTQKGETLEVVAPKIGFDLPLIDLDTSKVLTQFEYLTIYECYPIP